MKNNDQTFHDIFGIHS